MIALLALFLWLVYGFGSAVLIRSRSPRHRALAFASGPFAGLLVMLAWLVRGEG